MGTYRTETRQNGEKEAKRFSVCIYRKRTSCGFSENENCLTFILIEDVRRVVSFYSLMDFWAQKVHGFSCMARDKSSPKDSIIKLNQLSDNKLNYKLGFISLHMDITKLISYYKNVKNRLCVII